MSYSSWKKSLFCLLFSVYSSFSQAAVFQEPVDANAQKYKTRYLFADNFAASQIEMPELPAVQAPTLDSFVNETPTKVSSPQVQTLPGQEVKLPGQLFSPTNLQAVTGPIHIYASYERATVESVKQIVAKYKSVPGGITLEGVGQGLPDISQIQYDAGTNSFLMNGMVKYENPVSRFEMKSLLKALSQDDLMGVSLGDEDIIYGSLQEGSLPSVYMKLLDHFLGCVVFANNRWLYTHAFPENYRPKQNFSAGDYYAVYFNFKDYQFALDGNQIKSLNSRLNITLIPLTNQKDDKGGYIPDYVRIAAGMIPTEYEDNIHHVVKNMNYYQDEMRLRKVDAYGQAAAFVRALKEQGQSLNSLADSL
jgi:hypothetical protein